MSLARSCYRLATTLAALGLGAVVLTFAVALARVRISVPSMDELAAACRWLAPHDAAPATLLVTALLALAFAVLGLGARRLLVELRAHRQFLATLEPVEPLSIAGVPVTLIDDDRPQALCAGPLNPTIYISTGALGLLSDGELNAVVAHEGYHLERRDPLRILFARVLASALFFLPVLRRLDQRYAALAELAADEAALRRTNSRELASALLAFGGVGTSPATVAGIAPERVDHLTGHQSRWDISLFLALGSTVALAAVVGLALSVPLLAGNERVGIAALLAEGCMVAMAALPVALAVGAVSLRRSRLLQRSQS